MRTLLLSFILLSLTCGFGRAQSAAGEHKEYRSTEFQFSVDYPGDWSTKQPYDYVPREVRAEGNGIVVFYSPVAWDEDQMNMAQISICSQSIDGKLDDYAKDYCRPRDTHLSNQAKDQVISRRQVLVGGAAAEEIRTTVRNREEFYVYYVSFTVKDRKFFITGSFRKSSIPVFDTFKYEPVFDQLVKSFQFIDKGKQTE